jgi:hypothetical protein
MSADQGMGWPTWIALAGVLVNLIFNTANFLFNRNTRRKTVTLSDFNSNVREPIGAALMALDAVMDEADDIARSSMTHADQVKAAGDLSKKFHAARRTLARHLNDCDISELVRGDDWARCDEGHMDKATQAFDEASNTQNVHDLRDKFLCVAQAINSLRTDLRKKLDEEAKRLMR